MHKKVLLRSVRMECMWWIIFMGISYQLPLKLGTRNMLGCVDIWLVTHDMLGPGNMKDVWIFGWNGGG